MAKTASISLRIEPAVKAQLEALYASFGISVRKIKAKSYANVKEMIEDL